VDLDLKREREISYRVRAIPETNIVELMTETQRQRPLKHRKLPSGFEKFGQALKDTHALKHYMSNCDVQKAMEKQGKSVPLTS
jgi:hypothetical protein